MEENLFRFVVLLLLQIVLTYRLNSEERGLKNKRTFIFNFRRFVYEYHFTIVRGR